MLAGHRQQLETVIPEEIQNIEKEEKKLAQAYREDCDFSKMVAELMGTEDKAGLIEKLEDELQKLPPQKSNVTIASLEELTQSIEIKIEDLKTEKEKLSKASQQVSFKQLYEAVTQIQESRPEQCPACQTPLNQVKVNPFEHADAELKKLEHLGNLQEAVKTLESNIGTSLKSLLGIINTCCSRNPDSNPLSVIQIAEEKATKIDWWSSLVQKLHDGFTPLQHLEVQAKQLEAIDKEIEKTLEIRTEKQKEIKRLRESAEKIVKLKTRRESANSTKKKAEEAIGKFDSQNSQLIEDVEAEKAVVTQNQTIAGAYDAFVRELNAYNNGLPAQLVADLGEQVVSLYNAFNRNDARHERLADVRLPLSQNQRLEISFNNDPETFFDALYILSEGHIRCIGLAILTAKNIKGKCPILIFDDPVNAIDDDHRESIRRTLFEDAYFSDKQIILACHGEEFFKDILNLLSAEKAGQSKKVSFLPKIDEAHIRVDHDCAPRNYIIAARSHYESSEIRYALGKSRQALESLAKVKVWRYVNKHGDGNLSLKLRSANSTIELRNLTEQLESKIAKDDFSDENKFAVLNPIESLLGVSGSSREWRYLNKGTHEEADRAEFDRQTVNEIVTALEQLDAALG